MGPGVNDSDSRHMKKSYLKGNTNSRINVSNFEQTSFGRSTVTFSKLDMVNV